MRERVRESAIASLLASKRFVVAVCAAVAMILGAVSAGASVFTGAPADAEPREVSAIFTETDGSPSAPDETSLFTRRQTLASQTIAVEPPLYTADASQAKEKKGFNLKLNQEVLRTTNALFYNPESAVVDKTETPTSAAAAAAEPVDSAPTETLTPTDSETPTEPVPSEPAQPEDPATPATDPTTEPSLNSASPAPEETKQQ